MQEELYVLSLLAATVQTACTPALSTCCKLLLGAKDRLGAGYTDIDACIIVRIAASNAI